MCENGRKFEVIDFPYYISRSKPDGIGHISKKASPPPKGPVQNQLHEAQSPPVGKMDGKWLGKQPVPIPHAPWDDCIFTDLPTIHENP